MNFRDYLTSKKIDAEAFRQAEPALWATWDAEFAEMHPNSFTAQKLYLINPVRRKYTLQIEVVPGKTTSPQPVTTTAAETITKPVVAKPAIAKPMMKPKPAEPGTSSEATDTAPPAPPTAAKPVIPRPVMKPKPPTEQPASPEAKAVVAKDTTDDATQTQATETPVPKAKPVVKPLIPRPVVKPASPAPAPEATDATAGISSQEATPAPATAQPAPETPPGAKPAKPGMPRPVIKPPKPKTD